MALFRDKIFVPAAGALWLVFLFLDFSGMANSNLVKFAAICLCFAASLAHRKTADGKLVALALTLTVCADVYLLLLNDFYLMGVGLFCIVQLIYAFRLRALRGGASSALDILRLFAFGFGASQVFWGGGPVVGLAAFYFINLVLNLVGAFALKAEKPVGLFKWGLLLFLCCDICVGAWYLFSGLPDLVWIGQWFFYLPSQVLIVLSQQKEGDRA